MYPFIHIGKFTMPTFGLMMCLGMLAGLYLLFRNRKYTPYTEDDLMNAAIYTIIAGMLGSKLLYWITELRSIIESPKVFIDMLLSGFVFYGSLIGGAAGMLLYCRKYRKSFFALMDMFMQSLVLGQAFGRIGCFLAGCCYGRETSCAIGVVFPAGGSAPAGVPLIPTQLLESVFLFLLAGFLVWLFRRKPRTGTVFSVYCLLYGIWRFIIEFFRNDERGFVGALSTSQFIGIFIVLAGALMLYLVRTGRIVSRETIEDPTPDEETPDDKRAEETESDAASADQAASGEERNEKDEEE